MAKKKKNALPKRVAGVKIPKRVRKGPLGQFLTSPVGKAMLAEALVLAGAGLTAKESEPGSNTRSAGNKLRQRLKKAGRKALLGGDGASDQAAATTAAVAYAVSEAARRFTSALHERRSFAPRDPEEGWKPGASEPGERPGRKPAAEPAPAP
jgi:hypothetical protein